MDAEELRRRYERLPACERAALAMLAGQWMLFDGLARRRPGVRTFRLLADRLGRQLAEALGLEADQAERAA